jgi:hypothetical protein
VIPGEVVLSVGTLPPHLRGPLLIVRNSGRSHRQGGSSAVWIAAPSPLPTTICGDCRVRTADYPGLPFSIIQPTNTKAKFMRHHNNQISK